MSAQVPSSSREGHPLGESLTPSLGKISPKFSKVKYGPLSLAPPNEQINIAHRKRLFLQPKQKKMCVFFLESVSLGQAKKMTKMAIFSQRLAPEEMKIRIRLS